MKSHDFLLEYEPVRRFVEGVGGRVLKYFGDGKGCVVGYGDDGVLYGQGLYAWLRQKETSVTFTHLDRRLRKLEEEKIRGRKVLVVDSGITTGMSYRRAMDFFALKKDDLELIDVKYAVMRDRTDLSDFYVEKHDQFAGVPELTKIDSTDFRVLQILAADGRTSFADIAKETNLTVSGAKKRTERILRDGIVEVAGRVCISKFYSISALVYVDVASEHLGPLIEKLRTSPVVFCMVRTYGSFSLMVGVVASHFHHVKEFVREYISDEEGVRKFEMHIGDLPIVPSTK
jgi:DNA-binding Lrp family transcriptional regulator